MKAIDELELAEFTATLPEGIRDECFQWIGNLFDVPKALFLIKREKLEMGQIDVAKWCESMGMAGEYNPGSKSFNFFNGVSDDDAMQPHVNPEYPVVIVEHTFKVKRKTETTPLLIDGNKRLRRAFIEKKEKINAFYLSKDLVKLIKIR